MTSHPGRVPRTRSLAKAVTVLRAVSDRPGASVASLARETELPRATVTRIVATLADATLLARSDDGEGWVLGPELVRLARRADPYRSLYRAARPLLVRLRDQSGESALVGAPTGEPGQEILDQLDGPSVVGVASWVGQMVPLHASAAGKLVLADLPAPELDEWLAGWKRERFTAATITDEAALRAEVALARRRGWAGLVDELEEGLVSLSAGVWADDGRLQAMIGISGPTFRLGTARRRALVPEIVAAARALETQLRSRNAA